MADEDYFLIVKTLDDSVELANIETHDGDRVFYTKIGKKLLTEHGDNVWFKGAKFNYVFDEHGNFSSVKLLDLNDEPIKSLE